MSYDIVAGSWGFHEVYVINVHGEDYEVWALLVYKYTRQGYVIGKLVIEKEVSEVFVP